MAVGTPAATPLRALLTSDEKRRTLQEEREGTRVPEDVVSAAAAQTCSPRCGIDRRCIDTGRVGARRRRLASSGAGCAAARSHPSRCSDDDDQGHDDAVADDDSTLRQHQADARPARRCGHAAGAYHAQARGRDPHVLASASVSVTGASRLVHEHGRGHGHDGGRHAGRRATGQPDEGDPGQGKSQGQGDREGPVDRGPFAHAREHASAA